MWFSFSLWKSGAVIKTNCWGKFPWAYIVFTKKILIQQNIQLEREKER